VIKNNRFHSEYNSKHFLEQLQSIHHTRTLLLFLLKVLSISVKKFSVRTSIFIIIFINAFHCSSEILHHLQSIILIKIRHSITVSRLLFSYCIFKLLKHNRVSLKKLSPQKFVPQNFFSCR